MQFFSLGWCSETGIGLPQDWGKAVERYRRAADLGEASAMKIWACAMRTGPACRGIPSWRFSGIRKPPSWDMLRPYACWAFATRTAWGCPRMRRGPRSCSARRQNWRTSTPCAPWAGVLRQAAGWPRTGARPRSGIGRRQNAAAGGPWGIWPGAMTMARGGTGFGGGHPLVPERGRGRG